MLEVISGISMVFGCSFTKNFVTAQYYVKVCSETMNAPVSQPGSVQLIGVSIACDVSCNLMVRLHG